MRLKTKKLSKGLFNIVVILMASCMVITGCGQNVEEPIEDESIDNVEPGNNENVSENMDSENTSSGLESGFDVGGNSCASTGFYCAYKSEKNEFEIDDVTLEFYYGGWYYPLGAEYLRETTHDFPFFDVYFGEDEGEKVLVKRVEENFILDKYNVIVNFYERKHTFTFSEPLTIPKQLFSKETGIVYFYITGTNIKNGDKAKTQLITSINIFYKVTDGKVILSNTEFK